MSIVEWVVDEDRGRQFGVVQIAPAQLRTAYPQLASLTVCHRLSVLVNDIQAVSTRRLANGHIRLVAFHGVACDHAATLRRTIDIQECQSRWWCHRIQFFTAYRETAQ